MRKRRIIWVAVAAVALAVAWFGFLYPPSEPKYQGRSLSEWVELHKRAFTKPYPPEAANITEAMVAMGTNALPYYLKWMRYEPQQWRGSLYRQLPRWVSKNKTVSDWLVGKPAWRAAFTSHAFRALGTNAISAMPELVAMMHDIDNPMTAERAIGDLAFLGEPAIPVLRAALADPNHFYRWRITNALGFMAREGHNNCLAILAQILNDKDAQVRQEAEKTLKAIAPQLLTNAPAK